MGKIKIETRISREKERLYNLMAGLDKNKLEVCEPLIDRAAFLRVNLEDLEVKLNQDGWTEEYWNGKGQHGIKKSSAAEVHIALTKNLSVIARQLLDLVPPEQKHSKLQELMKK